MKFTGSWLRATYGSVRLVNDSLFTVNGLILVQDSQLRVNGSRFMVQIWFIVNGSKFTVEEYGKQTNLQQTI